MLVEGWPNKDSRKISVFWSSAALLCSVLGSSEGDGAPETTHLLHVASAFSVRRAQDPAVATGSLCRTVLFVVLPFLRYLQAAGTLLGAPSFGGRRREGTGNAQADLASQLVMLSWGRYLGKSLASEEQRGLFSPAPCSPWG